MAAKKSKGSKNVRSLALQGRSGADPAKYPGNPGADHNKGGKRFPKMVADSASVPGGVLQTKIGRPAINGNYKKGNAGNHDPGTPGSATGTALSNAKSCAKSNISGGAPFNSGTPGKATGRTIPKIK